MVHVTFARSVYDVVRDDNGATISLCVIYFQPVTKKREINVSNSTIAWKLDRWISSNAAKPRLLHFKVHD